MNTLVSCLCFAIFGILSTSSLPFNPGYDGYRSYQPRTMMITGYYGNPYRRSVLGSEGTMTAFVSGDNLATNSFAAEQPQQQEPVNFNIPLDENSVGSQNEQVQPQESPNPTIQAEVEVPPTRKSKKIPRRKPQRPVQEEEDDEEDEDQYDGYFPFQSRPGRRGNVPSYNSFFPIMFGGRSGGRTRSGEEGGYPGSATAIANSFSTGKAGVASSHAVAYGDPYVATLLRNGGNGKRRTQQQD